MSEELKDLMKGSALTGRVSEVHILNLRQYPFIFIDGVESVEISYDILTDAVNAMPNKKSRVDYVVTMKEGFPNSESFTDIASLKKAVNVLFQHSVEVSVKNILGDKLE